MPLKWTQVKAGLDPMHYTIRTVPALLKKNKPWRDYDKSGGAAAQGDPALIDSKEDAMAKARRKSGARRSGRCVRPGRAICGYRW